MGLDHHPPLEVNTAICLSKALYTLLQRLCFDKYDRKYLLVFLVI